MPSSSVASSSVPSSTANATPWKRGIIHAFQQRKAKQQTAYADVFGAYSVLLSGVRVLQSRSSHIESELVHARQAASSVSGGSTPASSSSSATRIRPVSGDANSTALASQTQVLFEQKISKLQEDLTAAYRLHAENAQNALRMKEATEKMEKALKLKEEELSISVRTVTFLQQSISDDSVASIDRGRHTSATLELLRSEVTSARTALKSTEANQLRLTMDNEKLLTEILKLRTSSTNEQSELDALKHKLDRATADAAAAKAKLDNAHSIAPAEIDMSDVNGVIDHVAWNSSRTVSVPTDRRRTIRAHRGPVTCARYNTAGTLFASAGTDGLVKIYDSRGGGNRASLRGTKDSVMNIAFSNDDAMLLASGNDSISRIWSLKTSRLVHTFVGHAAKVWASTFTSDGSRAVTGSHDRTVKIWDTELGGCKKSILCQSSCNYLSLDSADNILATAHLDTHVRFWSLKSGELMHVLDEVHDGQATSVEFTKDGTTVVTCSRDNTVKITDIRTYKVVHVLEGSGKTPFRNLLNWNRACFSPDDAHVIVGGALGEIFVWNVASGKLESILPAVNIGEGIYGTAGAASASASSSSSSTSTSSASMVAAANAVSDSSISCVDWNRNGRQVIACDQGGNIHQWEAEDK